MTTTETETVDWRDCRPVELTDILRHSSEAFYEHGFHGTTVRDIAARVGVTVPALYYHHANKEAILVAVLEAAIGDLLDRNEAAVADGGDDAVAQMANLVESVTLHLTVRARLAALDSEYRYLSPEARAPYTEGRKRNELLTRAVIDRGIEQGVFVVDDPAEATRALLGMLQAIPRWYVDSGPLTPADVATRYVGLSLALLGVAPRKD
ncbi:TetR/AcrR family transcriptional regulator [Nocardioides sp. YIM 152315]|uniref:TetR/AcrR family transcriptional regulator n=1 Tax=Nocardioides sp. YIM 152315 TaxID=3031760 RepID=UPI0023DAAC9A|nr:TetR/AcrR family transcriptional regulator [Nocardioides sp. YIM 152315]MDF1602142.1 TetR/AcrR family transcriptional regulator [Nocardioides sp. YIM 152315]